MTKRDQQRKFLTKEEDIVLVEEAEPSEDEDETPPEE
jgi:hypothetical protein